MYGGVEGFDRPALFPLAFSYAAFPASVCVDNVPLPLLAAGLVEALGMTMSKVASGGGCCWEPRAEDEEGDDAQSDELTPVCDATLRDD